MSWQEVDIESVRIHHTTRPTADQPHASTETAAEMEPFVQLSPLFTCFVWFVIVLVVAVVDGF